MTTLTEIPIKLIAPHPDNVRRDATPDSELVASVKAQGILQPLGVITAGKKYQLIAGHRRLAAAKQAGLADVPVIVLEHLDTRAKQIEAMLVENGRRTDLTPVEEAAAYEQLTLEGLSATAIAKATGRTAKTVKARLALTSLSDKASEALHGHQITLAQAEQLVELEADHELEADVVAAIGTTNFEWKLANATARLERRRETAAKVAEYQERGLPEVEKPEGGWSYQGPAPANWFTTYDKVDEIADGYWFDGDSTVYLICSTDPRKNSNTDAESDAERAALQAERDAEREALLERREALRAATNIRIRTLATAFESLQITPTLAAVLRCIDVGWVENIEAPLVAAYQAPWAGNGWQPSEVIAEHVKTMAPASVLGAILLTFMPAADDPQYVDVDDAQRVLDMFAALDQLGHPMSDIDQELKQAALNALAAAEDDEPDEGAA